MTSIITVLEVLNKSAQFLKSKDVPNARFDTECLLSKVLQCARLDLYLKFDHPLTEQQLNQMREYVTRRAKREPLQFILGEVPFYNLTFNVAPHTLIPRPETEELIEHLETFSNEKSPNTILDLGTGTGAIALALAQLFPDAKITATDINPHALELAQSNAHKNNLQDHVQLIQSNWFDNIHINAKFDWIISNPPYLTEEEWQTASPEVKQHEPKSALVANNEGLSDLFIILEHALPYLNTNGLIALETGIHQHQQLAKKAKQLGYSKSLSQKDLSNRERFFFAWQ
jgi:release factor glutamine methyltransferase